MPSKASSPGCTLTIPSILLPREAGSPPCLFVMQMKGIKQNLKRGVAGSQGDRTDPREGHSCLSSRENPAGPWEAGRQSSSYRIILGPPSPLPLSSCPPLVPPYPPPSAIPSSPTWADVVQGHGRAGGLGSLLALAPQKTLLLEGCEL